MKHDLFGKATVLTYVYIYMYINVNICFTFGHLVFTMAVSFTNPIEFHTFIPPNVTLPLIGYNVIHNIYILYVMRTVKNYLHSLYNIMRGG